MIMQIQYNSKTIEFQVEYRKRKTFEIRIFPPDKIRVRAPKRATEDQILQIVESKGKWITQKLFELKDIEYRKVNKEYINGESFMYLGKNYSLQLVENIEIKKPIVKLFQGKFYIETNTKDQDQLRQALESWYRKKSLDNVIEKIEYYKLYFNKKPRSIRVKEQKKRWGSCNSRGDLMFNWRISMAPSNVLDYIVVHEMCHMVYFNHSKEFWSLVERIMPDYREQKEWLKANGISMDL